MITRGLGTNSNAFLITRGFGASNKITSQAVDTVIALNDIISLTRQLISNIQTLEITTTQLESKNNTMVFEEKLVTSVGSTQNSDILQEKQEVSSKPSKKNVSITFSKT